MKAIRIIIIILLITNHQLLITLNAQIAINTDGAAPHASAMLEISESHKGILIPRTSTANRNEIINPAQGLMLYDTTTATFWYYDNDQWNEIRNGSTALSPTDMFGEMANTPDFSCLETKATLSLSNPISIAVSGNYAYIADAGSNDLKVVDISNPNAPTIITTLGIGGDPVHIVIAGNYAYVLDYNSDDLKIIDISNPNTPSIVSSLGIGSSPKGIVISGDYAYIVDSGSDDLKVINISNPLLPTQISSLNIGSSPQAIAIQDDYAYVVDEGSSDIKVIDISVPTTLSISGSLVLGTNGPQIRDVAVSGNYAYVLDSEGDKLYAIDVSDPTTPIKVDQLNFQGGSTHSKMTMSGNYIYAIADENEFKVMDISDPTDLTRINSLDISNLGAADVVVSGQYAYVLDWTNDNLNIINLACDINIGLNPITGAFTTNEASFADHSAKKNIQLNDYYLSNDGDDEGISIDDDGTVTFSSNVLLDDNYLSNDGDDEGVNIDEDGNVSLSNALTVIDDFIVGAENFNWTSGNEDKLFFDQSKGAFRVGRVQSDDWDEGNLGNYSFAAGLGNEATGNGSFAAGGANESTDSYTVAMGSYNEASGYNSTAFGYNTTANNSYTTTFGKSTIASGYGATALGESTTAPSYVETVIGIYNTTYTPNQTSIIDEDDRLFVIGNGTGSNSRSDAMIVYKNGNTEIDGTLRTTGSIGINDGNQTATLRSDESAGYIQLDVGGASHSSDAIFIGGVSTTTNEVIMMGSVGIGTDISSGASYKLEVAGSAAKSSGSMWTTTSDRRLKSNIETYTEGTSEIMKIKPVTFQYNQRSSYDTSVTHVGVIAQELMEVAPYMVDTFSIQGDTTTYYTVNASAMTYMLINTVQEQQSEIENQQAEIKELKELKTENANLKQRLSELEQQVNKINALEAKLEILLKNQ